MTKLEKLKAAAARGDWREALSIAAKFPRLGDHAVTIRRAHECAVGRGDFYRQMGLDPKKLLSDGIAALRERYRLPAE